MNILGFAEVSSWNFGIVSVIAFLIYIIIKDRNARSVWSLLGVPEARSVPFLGSVVELKKKGFVGFDIDCGKKYGKIYGSYWAKYLQLHVADPELAKEILVKRFSEFHFRMSADPTIKELQGMLSTSYGDQWRFQRTVLSPVYSSGKMRMMNIHVQKCCEQLLDCLKEISRAPGGRFEVRSIFGCYALDVIARTAFGIDINSQKDPNNDFVKYAKRGFGVEDIISLPAVFLSNFWIFSVIKYIVNQYFMRSNVFEQYEFFKKVTTSLMKERKRDTQKTKDFLQLMLDAHDEENKEKRHNVLEILYSDTIRKENEKGEDSTIKALTTQEVISNAFGFFLAGYHTTASAMTFLAYCLAVNPECQDKCIEEIDGILGKERPDYDNLLKLEYLNNCVNESLRLYGAAIRTNRIAMSDTEISGYRIPKSTVINVNIYAIHHDPEYWPDPEKFDPDRFLPENAAKRHPYAFLPFGHGPRHCIGMRLVYMEIKAAMAIILQNFKLVTCEKTEVPVKLGKDPLLKEENDIILKLEPRVVQQRLM